MGGSVQNELLAKTSLMVARFFIGQKEATGQNDGAFPNLVQEYYAGRSEHGAPWCALFAMWCIYFAAFLLGIKPMLPKTDSSTDLYLFARAQRLLLEFPIAGCLALQKGDGGTPGKLAHHTNRVTEVDFKNKTFISIDGNKGNSVKDGNVNNISDFYFVAVC